MKEIYCDICRKLIKNPHNTKQLELSFKSTLYYKVGECPIDESQGCFTVGSDCYRKELKRTRESL